MACYRDSFTFYREGKQERKQYGDLISLYSFSQSQAETFVCMTATFPFLFVIATDGMQHYKLLIHMSDLFITTS
jgi:hypothetical protein